MAKEQVPRRQTLVVESPTVQSPSVLHPLGHESEVVAVVVVVVVLVVVVLVP